MGGYSSEPAVEQAGEARAYSSRQKRQVRDSDYYLQREPIPGCPSFYDMGQPQVYKSEIIDNYRGTPNLTLTSTGETNGTVPWLVFTVKSTRPAAGAVRAVFIKLGGDGATAVESPASTSTSTRGAQATRQPVANGSGANPSPAASRKARRAPKEDPKCHLAALKVESDNCVSLHTMAVPFSEVESCGGFRIDNGKLVPGYDLYQTQGYLTWSDIIVSTPGNTTSTTYLSTFPLTFRRGIPGLFTPDTPIEDVDALLPPPPPSKIPMIAGIVGAVVGLLILALGTFLFMRNRKKEQKKSEAFNSAYLSFVSGSSDAPSNDDGAKKTETFSSETTVTSKSLNKSASFDATAFKDVELLALDSRTKKIQRVNSTMSVKNARVAGIVVESEPGKFAVITTKSAAPKKIKEDLEEGEQTPTTAVDEQAPVIPPAEHEIKLQLAGDAVPASNPNRSSFYDSIISTTASSLVPQSALPVPPMATSGLRDSAFWGPQLSKHLQGNRASVVSGLAMAATAAEEEAEDSGEEYVDESAVAYEWTGEDHTYLSQVANVADDLE